MLLRLYAKLNRKIQGKVPARTTEQNTVPLTYSNRTKLKKNSASKTPALAVLQIMSTTKFSSEKTPRRHHAMSLLNTKINYRSPRGVRQINRISFFNLSELMGAEENVFFPEHFGTGAGHRALSIQASQNSVSSMPKPPIIDLSHFANLVNTFDDIPIPAFQQTLMKHQYFLSAICGNKDTHWPVFSSTESSVHITTSLILP